jgi:hypothetical protein
MSAEAAPLKRTRRFFINLFQSDREDSAPIAASPPNVGTGRPGDRAVLGFAVAVLPAVAGAAAYVSYHHFYGLAIATRCRTCRCRTCPPTGTRRHGSPTSTASARATSASADARS